jgi:hypothetical protein
MMEIVDINERLKAKLKKAESEEAASYSPSEMRQLIVIECIRVMRDETGSSDTEIAATLRYAADIVEFR